MISQSGMVFLNLLFDNAPPNVEASMAPTNGISWWPKLPGRNIANLMKMT